MVKKPLIRKKIIVPIVIILIILPILMHTIKSYIRNENIVKEKDIIQEPLEQTSNENNEETKDKLKDLETEIESIKVPADGNKVLPNGMTLGDVKGLIDTQRNFCKQEGMSDEETNKMLEQIAKDMGTSLDEVNRIIVSEAPVVVEKPSTGGGSSGGNSGGSSGGNSGGGNSSSGNTGYVPPSQPSGEAVSPQFEDLILNGVGSTESDPDFNLEAN